MAQDLKVAHIRVGLLAVVRSVEAIGSRAQQLAEGRAAAVSRLLCVDAEQFGVVELVVRQQLVFDVAGTRAEFRVQS